ncbi:hypothetical protein FRC07_003046 [Ceratobasidium sp. 392]|nr:hypothetical protein FRC07_003046 [Ceratobasidium sp. 392]
MGDPVQRTAALSRTGTTSHDLAQIFLSSQEKELDNTSDVVTEVHYPNDFDLIDVLAICYSVQHDSEARQYTLQRYNCYFFVWTVLSCLARRVASWSHLFTSSAWSDVTQAVLDKLNQVSRSHDSKTKPSELAFRVSRLLAGKNDDEAPKFLLDALHTAINQDKTRQKVCEALARPLWKDSARVAIRGALHPAADLAADATRRHSQAGRVVLETACSDAVLKVARNVMDMQELRLVERQWDLDMHREWRSQAKAAIKEHMDEHRVGIFGRFCRSLDMAGCTIAGSVTGITRSFPACISEGPDTLKRFRAEWHRLHPVDTMPKTQQLASTICVSWLMVRFVTRVVAQYAKTLAIGAQVKYMNDFANTDFPCAPDWIDMTDVALSGAFDALSHLDNPEFMIACILRVLDGTLDFTMPRSIDDEAAEPMCKRWDKTWSGWVWQSVGDTLADALVNRLIESEPKLIKVTLPVCELTTTPVCKD